MSSVSSSGKLIVGHISPESLRMCKPNAIERRAVVFCVPFAICDTVEWSRALSSRSSSPVSSLPISVFPSPSDMDMSDADPRWCFKSALHVQYKIVQLTVGVLFCWVALRERDGNPVLKSVEISCSRTSRRVCILCRPSVQQYYALDIRHKRSPIDAHAPETLPASSSLRLFRFPLCRARSRATLSTCGLSDRSLASMLFLLPGVFGGVSLRARENKDCTDWRTEDVLDAFPPFQRGGGSNSDVSPVVIEGAGSFKS